MNCECGWCWGLSWESHIRRGGSASLRAEGSRLHLVLFNSDIGLELDAENEFGGHGLDAVRNFSDLVHALLNERAEFLVDSSAPFAPLGRGYPILALAGLG